MRKPGFAATIAILLSVAVLWFGPAMARELEPVVLPPGTVLVVYTGQEANDILIAQGRATPSTKSWDDGGSVTQVKTSQVEHYVRVYAHDPSRTLGGAAGSWMMRASSLRGMSAQQIQDLFALPSSPTYVTCVRVPAGTSLWTGTAGPISGWGDGGAQQMMLNDRIDLSNYIYQRALGQSALWYAPQVANNPNRVGFYLDHLPKAAAYSDLEYVFNMLDYLAASPLASALEQIGPSRYDALGRVAVMEVVGLNQALAGRARVRAAGDPDQGLGRPNLWVTALGSTGRQREYDGLTGWRYRTSAMLAGLDYAAPHNLVLGLALGLTYSDLNYDSGLGDGRRTTPTLSLYSGWAGGPWDANLSLSGGPSQATLKRNLIFSELSRTATGHPDGYLLGLGFSGGYTLAWGEWRVRPQAGLDLLQYQQQSLAETGANALNLSLDDYSASTARTSLGASISRTVRLAGGATLTPVAGLAWTWTAPLDSRAFTSSLSGQGGSFSTQGDTRARHGLNPTLGLSVNTGSNLNLALSYSSEIREDLVAHGLELSLLWRF